MDTFERLAHALVNLPDPYGPILFLRFFEERTVHEIAEHLEVPESVAKTGIAHGLKMLRQQLHSSMGPDWRARCSIFTIPLVAAPAPAATLTTALALTMKAKLLFTATLLVFLSFLYWQPWSGKENLQPDVDQTLSTLQTEGSIPETTTALANPNPIHRADFMVKQDPILMPPLDPDLDLNGIVVDENGLPIAGVALEVQQPLHRQASLIRPFLHEVTQSIAHLESNAEGRFRVRLQPLTLFDLDVAAEGFGWAQYTNVYAGETLRIELVKAATVHGRVTNSVTGLPIPDALVSFSPAGVYRPGFLEMKTITDEDGRYVLRNMAANDFGVNVFAQGFCHPQYLSTPIASGQVVEHNIRLDPGRTIQGRISDATTNAPIAGAIIRTYGVLYQEAVTDMDGHYVLQGVAPTLARSIFAAAPGYGRYDYALGDVPEKGLEVDLGLLPGRIASGRLVDREGEPIVDAYIAAYANLFRPQFGDQQRDQLFTRSDAEGFFVLKGLRVDLRHTLFLTAQGFGSEVFDFPESEWSATEMDLGEITLNPAASISGRVLNPEGNPITGMVVQLNGDSTRRDILHPYLGEEQGYQSERGFGLGDVRTRTDTRGRYVLAGLPAGEYWLWAGAKGYARGAEDHLVVMRGEQVEDFDLTLDAGLSIRGFVVDGEGRPIPGQTVALVSQENPSTELTYSFSLQDGSFQISGLEPGTFSLKCEPFVVHADSLGRPRYFADAFVEDVAAGSEGIRIVLPETVSTTGIVLGPSGEPVPMVNVYFTQRGFGHMLTTTNSLGEFTVWLQEGKMNALRFYPAPEHEVNQWAHHYDNAGKIDMSYEFVVESILSGAQNLVIQLPKISPED